MLAENDSARGLQLIQDALDAYLRLDGEGAGELLLIRHAEPAAGSAHDPMLSCHGLVQAERLADSLRDVCIETIFSAPERRALQTARLLTAAGGRPLHVLDCLADVEIRPQLIETAAAAAGYVNAFAATESWDGLAGLEPTRAFRRRVIHAIERVIAISPGKRVAVVTHASAINVYLSMLLAIPAYPFFTPEHSSVSLVRWRDGRYALRSLNDLTHLSNAVEDAVAARLFTSRSLPLTSR